MGVVNTKSVAITNRDASPPVSNNAPSDGGFLRTTGGTVEVAAADSDTSVFRFCRVPSNAVIRSIRRFNDAITGGTVYDIGLHQTAANGGAAADADVFGADVDISSASVTGVEQRFTTADIAGCEKRVWELLNLSSDPGREYDITMTGDTVGSGAGTITLLVSYAT